MRLRLLAPLLLPLVFTTLATFPACSDKDKGPYATPYESSSAGSGGSGGEGGQAPTDKWPNLACDPLVPEVCAYPFPSNVFTVADESTPTGRRLAISDTTLPVSFNGYQPKGTPWSKSDGFSPGMGLLAYFPGATATGAGGGGGAAFRNTLVT